MRRGTRVGQAYVAATVDGDGINEGIVDAFDDAGKDLDSKGEEHGEKYSDGFSDGFINRMRGRLASRLGSVMSSRDEAGRAGSEAGDSFVEKMGDKVRDLGDKIGSELSDRLASNPEQVRRGIDRAFDDDFIDRIGDRLGSRLASSMSDAIDRQSGLISEAIEGAVSGNGRGGRRGGGLGDIIGRAFGAGARNNFLNILGRSIGGIVNLTERAGKFASGFADGLKKAGDNAGLLARLMSGLSGGAAASGITGVLTKITASGPLAVAALAAVLVTLSAMVSVVGALIGLLTALASTITSALVGALAVVGPLLGAMAVSIGLITVAFTSLTNAQSAYLSRAFTPFKEALTGIGQIIITQFMAPLYNGQSAIQVWSANLQKALVPLAGVAALTARAFADAGNTITASLSGPGFQRFFAALGDELPTIVRNLSSALGAFLNGVGGMFAAIMPFVTQFSRYLNNVATSFSNFANSARGQNSIRDFVARALDSLKSLWGFIKQFTGLISDVFFNPVSQRAGNSIFDRLAGAFRGFRDSFNKAVRDGSVQRWFNDAIKFGGALWSVIKGLSDIFFALYNSGVLSAVSDSLQFVGTVMRVAAVGVTALVDAVGAIPRAFSVVPAAVQAALGPLTGLWGIIQKINGAIQQLSGGSVAAMNGGTAATPTAPGGFIGPWAPGTEGNPVPYIAPIELPDLESLISSGNTALNNTYESAGGYMPDPSTTAATVEKIKTELKRIEEEWANPYIDFANALIKRAPGLAEEIRTAAREAGKILETALIDVTRLLRDFVEDTNSSLAESVRSAAQSFDPNEIADSLRQTINNAIEAGNAAAEQAYASAGQTLADAQATRDQLIAQGQAGVQAAAQALASATTEEGAKEALKALRRAEKDLAIAQQKGRELVEQAERIADQMRAGAEAQRQRIGNALTILDYHSVLSLSNVQALIDGAATVNVTLADYAEARRVVAERLASATEELGNALSLRNNYAQQVTASIQSFGALTTAQAKTLNGVAQALTFTDITDNLRDRLDKIKAFNENLRQLLAQGLSQAAYKQIVDAGVETGGQYAEAILAGGQGAVSEVNSLVGQIDSMSTTLGNSAANAMYQAGVDAARGLVEGLTSLSEELATAATQLGEIIAQAIAETLGIASPSKRLRGMMGDVGDGAVLGLDDQHPKLAQASARFSDQIKVSPEVARYAAEQGQSPTIENTGESVSGNAPKFLWTGDIVTPTEDPHAVTTEVLNELTERLT